MSASGCCACAQTRPFTDHCCAFTITMATKRKKRMGMKEARKYGPLPPFGGAWLVVGVPVSKIIKLT